jgi:hypothetical protein
MASFIQRLPNRRSSTRIHSFWTPADCRPRTPDAKVRCFGIMSRCYCRHNVGVSFSPRIGADSPPNHRNALSHSDDAGLTSFRRFDLPLPHLGRSRKLQLFGRLTTGSSCRVYGGALFENFSRDARETAPKARLLPRRCNLKLKLSMYFGHFVLESFDALTMENFRSLMGLNPFQIGPGVERKTPRARRARETALIQHLLDLSCKLSLLGRS